LDRQVRDYIIDAGGGDLMRAAMAHLVDKQFVQRANTAVLLSILWGGLAACAIGAMIYDIAYWLKAW
jgi:hypothetical protein